MLLAPVFASDLGFDRSLGEVRVVRIANLPASHQEPDHEKELSEESDKRPAEVAGGPEVGSDGVDYVPHAGNRQDDSKKFWDVAGRSDESTHEDEVNSKQYESEVKLIVKGAKMQENLGLQLQWSEGLGRSPVSAGGFEHKPG